MIKASRFPRAFQVFDLVENKFYSPEQVISIGLTLTADGLPYWVSQPKEVALLWYSGQKDFKGVPLFEGDICRLEVQNEFGSLIPDVLAVMRWDVRDSRFILHMAGTVPHQFFNTNKVEKIGHEFTHPDLLKQIEDKAHGQKN